MNEVYRIGIISGKLADVDGVSLEVDKWIAQFSAMGHEIFTFAGKYASPVKNVKEENQFTLPELRFDTPDQHYYEQQAFPFISGYENPSFDISSEEMEEDILHKGEIAGAKIFSLIKKNNIDLIIAQNTNAMPMSLIAGAAVYRLAVKDRIAVVFHHHDFWWERSRFSSNRIEHLLNKIMPPTEPGLEHVTISSYAAHMLRSFKRINPHVIPNCEDFSNPPSIDDYNRDFRQSMGFKESDILFVQPTRIVPRKRIEDSIRLVAGYCKAFPQKKENVRFVISLYQGDELNEDYLKSITNLARHYGIPLDLISDRVASVRKINDKGEKIFTNRDVLLHADIITYLPVWEGFGNAFLEAIAAKKPVIISTYLVYKTDIKGLGFSNIEIRDEYSDKGELIIPNSIYPKIHQVLNDPDYCRNMTENNFIIGKEELGYKNLYDKLALLLEDYSCEIKASRARCKKKAFTFSV